jgi:DNA-binding Lrp family transcriptional regulator
MDPLDFAIYRALSPGGEARFWAGRRIIDPTIPVRAVAGQVGISENGTRARLQGLARRGYLRGRTVVPNPSLFGARVFVGALPVREAGEVERIYRDLALVEGTIFARDLLDEGNRQVLVYFASDGAPTTARRAALLRRLSPTGQVVVPQPYWIPPCDRELSPLDWRILQAICRSPEATPSQTARAAKISLRTAARRLRQLVDSKACWWTHGPDSEEFPLALVRVDVRDPAHRAALAAQIFHEAPTWMPVAADGLGLEPDGVSTVIAGLVPADAPILLERFVRKLVGIPGVVKVGRTFALGSLAYPAWFTERVAERVGASAQRSLEKKHPPQVRYRKGPS